MIAKPQLRLRRAGENKLLEMHTPERVLPKITSKEKLLGVLDWYSYPFIRHRVPDSPDARRRYVELVRPALRWFCKKYGVEVPKWLEGNAHYDQLDPEEHEEMFGNGGPLNAREFEEITQAKGSNPEQEGKGGKSQ